MKILVCDNYTDSSINALKTKGYEVVSSQSLTLNPKDLKDISGLLIRSRTKINKELIEKASSLKVIVSATAGFDHIDHSLCKAKNIQVMHTPQANAQSAAELTINFILNALKNFSLASTELHQSQKWRDQVPRGNTLADKSVGIIGLGRIGFKVANLCKAFNANLSYFDPYVESKDFFKFNNLEELLKSSDIITLHVPLTQKTKYLIRKKQLDQMKSETILINCSRGLVVNQADLTSHIKENPKFKAGLDVFNLEPCKDQELLNLYPQFIGTPHIGAYTHEALESASHEAVEKLDLFFKSKKVSDTVPPHAAWAKDL